MTQKNKKSVAVSVETVDGMFRLMITTAAGTSPAGPRLERGEPMPVTAWEHFDEREAQLEADALQSYIDTNHCPKRSVRKH